MKRASVIFLQTVIVLIGVGVLALMLWEPHLEGRNVGASTFEIYFKDPFLAYAYLASIAFFVALYKTFKLLGYVVRHELRSRASVSALRTIKYCGLVLIAAALGAELYFFIAIRGQDDIAGGVAMGLFMMIIAAAITTVAAVLERRLSSLRY